MSSLRDRIAAAIEVERNQWAGGDAASETLADAVIAALGLHRDDELDEYGNYQPTGKFRYVTGWENDD